MNDSPVQRQRLISNFIDLLKINTTSRRESAMAAKVTALLEELGIPVKTDAAAQQLHGDTSNLIAMLPGTIAASAILFCAHIDTVASTEHLQLIHEQRTFRTDGSTILGADDKAGVAAIIEVLHLLLESGIPHPPVEILFTVAEEIGVMGSMVLSSDMLSARIGFVPDSSGAVGAIITRAPAQKHLAVTIQGRAAHAGMTPEKGISAITVAARAIARMRQGRIDEETTANIGVIHGGKATNIIPETVTLEGEARSRDPQKLDAQVNHMRACFEEEATNAGATAVVEVSDVYPAFNLQQESQPVNLATRALHELDITPIITSTGGGSDANFLNGYGIQTVILSSGYYNPHSSDEYMEEDQLVLLTQWLYQIVRLAGEDH